VTFNRSDRTVREYVGLVLRGMAMGSADIVPGVSGGTMAFILGIYEELIGSIKSLGSPEVYRALFQGRIRDFLALTNFWFLLSVAGGIGIAVLTLARGLEYLLLNHPVLLWSFFFGLVLASVIAVSRRIERWQPVYIAALVIGAVLAWIFVGLVPVQTPDAWWFLVLSGAIAICAMILPGVSGSFLLVLLGKYQYVLSAVTSRDLGTIALVGIGAVFGLILFSQFLGWLLARYREVTIATLIGLMLGSLRKVWPWKVDVEWLRDAAGGLVLGSDGHPKVVQQENFLPAFGNSADYLLPALLLMVAGFALVLTLEYVARRSD
jgi:putative membrane protein